MGCDIHIVVERRGKHSDHWVGIYATDYLPGGRPPIAKRDYDFFAAVAGVRGDGGHPRNLPEDVSDLAWKEYIRCPTDHHSVSHMTAADFAAAHHKTNPNNSRDGYEVYDLLGVYGEGEGEYRVVFWFDN